jgi:hypothetical protein
MRGCIASHNGANALNLGNKGKCRDVLVSNLYLRSYFLPVVRYAHLFEESDLFPPLHSFSVASSDAYLFGFLVLKIDLQ